MIRKQRSALALVPFCVFAIAKLAYAQAEPPAAYRTRTSQCRHVPPEGTPLSLRRSDSGVIKSGYTAERVLTYIGDARRLTGGDIVVCTEYGRVEITDSDDSELRLQVRMEGFGEGSERPDEAAARVLDETNLHVHTTAHRGKLLVRVWHSTLGFTAPGAQPAWVNVRMHVPRRGPYRLRVEAFHGMIAVRRLTIADAVIRGNVGEKFKGISGFVGATELDNVELAGNVDIDNLIGLRGIREPVTPAMSALAAPVFVKARVSASSQLKVVTGGNVNIAIQPSPNLGVRAIGESNNGRVNIAIERATTADLAGDASFAVRRSATTPGYDGKTVKIDIRASSIPGNINIASIPAAPLPNPRRAGASLAFPVLEDRGIHREGFR